MSPVIFKILLSLRDEPRDAEAILERIEELDPGGAPALASFYRSLKRAVDAGHLMILEAAPSEGRGRPPQRYRMTRGGKAALASEARRLGRLAQLALRSDA